MYVRGLYESLTVCGKVWTSITEHIASAESLVPISVAEEVTDLQRFDFARQRWLLEEHSDKQENLVRTDGGRLTQKFLRDRTQAAAYGCEFDQRLLALFPIQVVRDLEQQRIGKVQEMALLDIQGSPW